MITQKNTICIAITSDNIETKLVSYDGLLEMCKSEKLQPHKTIAESMSQQGYIYDHENKV
jgi:hypothetical protein